MNRENIVYVLNNNNNIMYSNHKISPDQQHVNIISQTYDSSLSLSSSPKSYDTSEKALNQSTSDLLQSFDDSGVFETSIIDDFGKKKRINRFFSPSAVGVLKKWFYEHDEYPYPDDNMTTLLAKEANISTKQVRKWFANKRVRSNKCYKQIYRSKRKSSATEDGESPISNQKMINSKSLYAFEDENFDHRSIIPKSESLPNIDAIQFNYEISRVMFALNLSTVTSNLNQNLRLNSTYADESKYQQQDQQQQVITQEQNQNLNALVANIIFYSNMIEMQKQYSAFANQAWASVISNNLSTSATSTSSTGTTLSTSPSPSSSSSSSNDESYNNNNNNNNDNFDCTDCMFETDNFNKVNNSNDNINKYNKFSTKNQKSKVNFGDVSDLIN